MYENTVLKIPSDMSCITLVTHVIEDMCTNHSLIKSDIEALIESVEELINNAVTHAYKDGKGYIEVSIHPFKTGIRIDVRDWGRGFESNHVEKPDVEAPLEERTLGGLGLYIVNKVMDEVEFTFDPKEGNRLRMAKRMQVAG